MPTPVHPAVTRVRALQAQRWPLHWIAEQLGYPAEIPFLADSPVSPEEDRCVRALFERTGDRQGPCEDSAIAAHALGYWPAIHYDEDMRFIRGSIRGVTQITDPDRYRRYLVILALTVRDFDHAMICRVLNEDPDDRAFEKVAGRTRREIGLRMRSSSKMILEPSRLMPEQAPLFRAIRDHTRGIAVLELVDELDDPDLNYRALWRSLCDTADLLMNAGAAGTPAAEQWPEIGASLAATLSVTAA